MKWSVLVLSVIFLGTMSTFGEDKGPNWVKVTDQAGWQPRDSQGEVVYKDQLWIFGGWFQSFEAPPRDVWSSPDGKTWKLVAKEAPWKHSDLAMTLVFDDKMWIMGGWYNGRLPGHSASSAVWWSTDGVKWEQATPSAGWSPRIAAAVVVFKGKMWMLGGTENYYFGDEKSLKNDVWYSADGHEWKLATENAGWSPRAYHQAVVLNDKIYLFGGGNYVPQYHALNDVWCSEDGINWTKVTDAAAWPPRLWFSSVVYRDRMWVLGGWSNNPSKNWGDVWYSKDGKNWTQLKSDVIWKERHEHSAYVFQDKIWVAGGHAQPLSSEVWSLEIPKGWTGQDAGADEPRPQRLIYNSDADNMFIYTVPPMKPADVHRYVDEIADAGVSTLFTCPNYGMVMNYPSRVAELAGLTLTPQEAEQIANVAPVQAASLERGAANLKALVIAGHDPLGLVIERARQRKLEVFVTCREGGGEPEFHLLKELGDPAKLGAEAK